eukprot:TRINITY_DN6950_c0_g2_i1.p1 TRINITY_DN6950_c0_g2~~TRINITY_DN6950_c0_g2_i1.p1  ORF type:complete len:239 (+),score=44.63 TRINITY_DN6950_c0_g2_i1:63-779(+)
MCIRDRCQLIIPDDFPQKLEAFLKENIKVVQPIQEESKQGSQNGQEKKGSAQKSEENKISTLSRFWSSVTTFLVKEDALWLNHTKMFKRINPSNLTWTSTTTLRPIGKSFSLSLLINELDTTDVHNKWKVAIGVSENPFQGVHGLDDPELWSTRKDCWSFIIGNGFKLHQSRVGTPYADVCTKGDEITILVMKGKLWFEINGNAQPVAFHIPEDKEYFVFCSLSVPSLVTITTFTYFN